MYTVVPICGMAAAFLPHANPYKFLGTAEFFAVHVFIQYWQTPKISFHDNFSYIIRQSFNWCSKSAETMDSGNWSTWNSNVIAENWATNSSDGAGNDHVNSEPSLVLCSSLFGHAGRTKRSTCHLQKLYLLLRSLQYYPRVMKENTATSSPSSNEY